MKNDGHFTRARVIGSKNFNWKGAAVGYDALHAWVRRHKGKPIICADCGGTKNLQWANISGKYKRVLNDWKPLCCICHRAFDKITKLTKSQAAIIKEKIRCGVTQITLAKRYKVDQATISNIKKGKIKYYA